jgi:type VI secretion system protein ImpC
VPSRGAAGDTGGGGNLFTLDFIGRSRFEGLERRLTFSSDPTQSETQEREGLVRVMALGLTTYAAETSAAAGLREREVVPVDRDDLDDVLRRYSPSITLPASDLVDPATLEGGDPSGAPELTVTFRAMEGFHPDRLVQEIPVFRRIRDAFRDGAGAGDPTSAGGEDPGEGAAAGGDLLDQIVEQEEGEAGPGAGRGRDGSLPGDAGGGSDELADYVRRIVRPHLVPGPDPEERARLRQEEAALQATMRRLLHHDAFRALESVWRGVEFLVRRVETGPDLGIHLMDVSRSELEAALSRPDPGESPLYSRIVEGGAGAGPAGAGGTANGAPWSLLVGHYEFGPDDAGLLQRLARLAGRAGAPFLSAAAPGLAGLATFRRRPSRSDWREVDSERWRELRRSDEARWLGLALPRFLLRQPYDPDDAPCRRLELREIPPPGKSGVGNEEEEEEDEIRRHERYLWGNPAWLCSALLCRSFGRAGWEMRPGMDQEAERLPLHIYERRGRAEAKPSAEMLMTEDVAVRLLESGFIPVASIKERGAARVVRFQSVAHPPAPLAGRWS